ncbi:MAG: hypothetical protein ACFFBZ_06750 [Promethearchaeota archaeon]
MVKVKKKKKEPEPELDVTQSFENVKVLVQTERSTEAIAYIYLVYNDLVRKK